MTTLDVRHAVQKFRVFIFGYEVTEDLLSVSFSCHDGREPSTANITLTNSPAMAQTGAGSLNVDRQTEKYLITPEDLLTIYDFDADDEDLLRPIEPVIKEKEAFEFRGLTYKATAEDKSLDDVARRFGITAAALTRYNPSFMKARGRRGRVEGWTFAIPQNYPTVIDVERTREIAAKRFERLQIAVQRNLQDLPDPKRTIISRKVGVLVDQVAALTRLDPSGKVVPDDRVATSFDVISGEDFDLRKEADILSLVNIAGKAPTYPLVAGAPVFHTSDTARVFMNDPMSPGDWYFAFAGKVSSWSTSINFNEESTLSLTLEDVRRDLKYARVVVNPGVIDQSAGTTEDDLAYREFQQVPLRNKPLEEKVYTLLFGFELESAQEGDPRGIKNVTRYGYYTEGFQSKVLAEAVGGLQFRKSATFLLGEAGREDEIPDTFEARRVNLDTASQGRLALQSYLAYTDLKVRKRDLYDLDVGDERSLKRLLKEVDVDSPDDIVTFIGQHPERYPADGGRFFFLLPASLGTAQTQIFKLGFNDVASKTDFLNRLQIILDITDSLDFSIFVDGRGDLHLELPLRDFDPYDLGTEPISGEDVVAAMGADKQHPFFKDTLKRLRDEQDLFDPPAPKHVIPTGDESEHQRSFVDERIRTIFRSESFLTPLGSTDAGTNLRAVVVRLPAMHAAFGPRAESMEPNFYFGPNPENAEAAAKFFALTELNKINAEATEVSFVAHPARVGLLPNRPIEVYGQGYVGTIRNVEYSWSPGENPTSMTLNLNSVRSWSGGRRTDGGTRFYPGIAGDIGTPLNYAERLGLVSNDKDLPEKESTESQEATAAEKRVQENARRNFG